MKTTLSLFALAAFAALSSAQNVAVAATGYNADVIADGSSSANTNAARLAQVLATTSQSIDGTFNYYAAGFAGFGSTAGLPTGNNRTFTSGAGTGTQFQFQAYAGNNALLLDAGVSGTLSLALAESYTSLSFLSTGLNGAQPVSYSLNFLDGSSTSGTFTAPDNFNVAGAAISGFGRVSRGDGGISAILDNPRMYETQFSLSEADAAKKLVSIGFTNTSTTFNQSKNAAIFALSGAAVAGSPTPEPATLAVLGIGAAAVARRRRR